MRLQELTGYESGVVLYGNETIVSNWSGINSLPRLFATSVIGLGDGDDLTATTLTDNETEQALQAAREEGDPAPVIDRAWRNEQAVVVTFEGWC